jgi:hypothetical protein
MKVVRAGVLYTIQPPSHVDPIWTAADIARYATLQARCRSRNTGIVPVDHERLLECAVWKRKFPGLKYTPVVESQLQQLVL